MSENVLERGGRFAWSATDVPKPHARAEIRITSLPRGMRHRYCWSVIRVDEGGGESMYLDSLGAPIGGMAQTAIEATTQAVQAFEALERVTAAIELAAG